jgi:hypothetical protein
MAYTGLTHISKILQDITDDLEALNKRFDEREKENGRSILPASDAGIARTSDQTTGESK